MVWMIVWYISRSFYESMIAWSLFFFALFLNYLCSSTQFLHISSYVLMMDVLFLSVLYGCVVV